MVILLVRAATLPGSEKGIRYFLAPQWDKLWKVKVWYAATTQVFYSLSVGMGSITMFSSYNKFNHNIYRDAMIVTTFDTFTSLLAGMTIFSILGNLAYNTGVDDIGAVVKTGTTLAFISYPNAIATFDYLPQVHAIRSNINHIEFYLQMLIFSYLPFYFSSCYWSSESGRWSPCTIRSSQYSVTSFQT